MRDFLTSPKVGLVAFILFALVLTAIVAVNPSRAR